MISNRMEFLDQVREHTRREQVVIQESADPLQARIDRVSSSISGSKLRDILESLYERIKVLENDNLQLTEKVNAMEFYD